MTGVSSELAVDVEMCISGGLDFSSPLRRTSCREENMTIRHQLQSTPALTVDNLEVQCDSDDPWRGVEDLYVALVPKARRMAYLVTGDMAEAEDVVHEAFLKVAAKRETLREPAALPKYLHKAVLNEISSRKRSLVRRLRRQNLYCADVEEAVDDCAIYDVRQELLDALSHLTTRQRRVIVLTYFLDHSDDDIAAIVGCALGTIKSLRSRGLSTLRKVYGDQQLAGGGR